MDRFTRMQAYIAVAEEEGFAAASRKLGVSPPVVTRAIAELEAHLGVQLLIRTTRHVKVTDAGKRFLTDARQVLDELRSAEEAAAGINTEPSGHLSVTASVMFGQRYVLPTITHYLKSHPGTEVNGLFVDRLVNMLEEGIDVGIRIAHLPDSSLRAIPVGSVRSVLVATQDYLQTRGIPRTVKDLDEHTIISAAGSSLSAHWRFRNEQLYKPAPRLTINNNRAVIDAVKSGLGIARLISYQVAPELEAGTLKTLLSDIEPEPVPIHILHRESHRGSSKVRTFVDMLAADLRANKSLQ